MSSPLGEPVPKGLSPIQIVGIVALVLCLIGGIVLWSMGGLANRVGQEITERAQDREGAVDRNIEEAESGGF